MQVATLREELIKKDALLAEARAGRAAAEDVAARSSVQLENLRACNDVTESARARVGTRLRCTDAQLDNYSLRRPDTWDGQRFYPRCTDEPSGSCKTLI